MRQEDRPGTPGRVTSSASMPGLPGARREDRPLNGAEDRPSEARPDVSRQSGSVHRTRAVFFLTAVVTLILDIVTKRLIVATLHPHQVKQIIGDWVRLTYIHNPGAAFGLFPGSRGVLIAVSIAAVFVVTAVAWNKRHSVSVLPLGLILGARLEICSIASAWVKSWISCRSAFRPRPTGPCSTWPIPRSRSGSYGSPSVSWLRVGTLGKTVPSWRNRLPDWHHRVTRAEAGVRLDRFLEGRLGDFTRSQVKRLVDQGLVRVEGRAVKAGHPLRSGELLEVDLPPPPAALTPEDLPFEIVHEDEGLLVIMKPAGLAVHPGAGRPGGTLVNALLARKIP